MIHPRKTGGTALTKFFEQIDPGTIETSKEFNAKVPPYEHQTASQIKKLVGDDIWNSYYKFAFIRNPFDWVRSYYIHEHKMVFRYNNKAFDRIRILLEWRDKFIINDKTISTDNIISLYMLMKWWYPPIGNVGQVSWFDEPIDKLYLFENFNSEILELSERLGFEYSVPEKVNVSGYTDTVMGSDVYGLISILFKEDIDLYNSIKLNNNTKHIIG
jgi:hypothetical protein